MLPIILRIRSITVTLEANYSKLTYTYITLDCSVTYGNAYLYIKHRRRMKLEEKAKVVASVWGAEFVQFLAALVVLLWSI